jgi:hypothetical protein
LMLVVKAIGVWRDEYDEIMDIIYRWVGREKREKGDQVLIELRSQHEDDKCRRYSSQNLWIASEDSTRDW